jgi:hypothetical protein
MWQGLQTIRDYKGKHSRELPSDTSLPDELNYFYARFEANKTETCMGAPAVPGDCVIMISSSDVSKTFKQVNIHKAAGPDGLPGQVKRAQQNLFPLRRLKRFGMGPQILKSF